MLRRPRSASLGSRPLGVSHAVPHDLAAPDDDRPFPHRAYGGVHLLFGDLTMLVLVGRDEIVNSAKPAVVVELQAQSVVHPGAHRLRHAGSHGGMSCGDEIRVDSHGQAALCSHTESVHLSHSNGISN